MLDVERNVMIFGSDHIVLVALKAVTLAASTAEVHPGALVRAHAKRCQVKIDHPSIKSLLLLLCGVLVLSS